MYGLIDGFELELEWVFWVRLYVYRMELLRLICGYIVVCVEFLLVVVCIIFDLVSRICGWWCSRFVGICCSENVLSFGGVWYVC